MEQLQVQSRSRPVRIAFFVALDAHAHDVLDAIFQCSFAMWGGRFSLVVPCVDGAPLPSYVPWLKAFDADLIYSYVDMSESKEASVHEELYPSALTYHPIVEDKHGPRLSPDLPIAPLGVATLLPWASLPAMFDHGRGVRVIHAMGRHANDRFIKDNFGEDFQVLNALRSRLAPYGSPLIVAAADELGQLRSQLREGEETLPDVASLLSAMATRPRDRSLAQLSAIAAPRFSVEDRRWGRSFNLVVGDAPEDRIMYWNARSFVPAWRDGGVVDLCVSPRSFQDPIFVQAIAEFLARRNSVNEGNNSGPPQVTLRSISLTEDELAPCMEALKAAVKWQGFECAQIASLDVCAPEAEALARAGLATGRSLLQPGLWREGYGTAPSLRLNAAQPDHLKALPRELLTPESGAWAVDLDIERSLDHSPYDNISHRWRLPRRIRVTDAFCRSYQLIQPHGRHVSPRVCNGGLLTTFTNNEGALPLIEIPSDYDAIRIALQNGRNWTPIHRKLGDAGRLGQLCYAAERSDAGQHFFGVYQMFGTLRAARSILLHKFWWQQLEKLGATEQRSIARHDGVLQQIQRRLGDRKLDLADDKQRAVLANLVLQTADVERTTNPNLNWAHLARDFEVVIQAFVARSPAELTEQEMAEERESYVSGLRECVQHLCELGILNQGYELKCPKCLHRNWVALGDLKATVPCHVCHHPGVAPVDRPWQFQLNGFLRESLQRHGMAPLFWVLARYQQEPRSQSLWFEGPMRIYFDAESYDRQQAATDIDLTIVQDGKVTMCEAKRSERAFRDPEGAARIFSVLRPDVALIAVMEAPSRTLKTKFDTFAAALAGTGIEPRLWTLDEERDFEDAPWFAI